MRPTIFSKSDLHQALTTGDLDVLTMAQQSALKAIERFASCDVRQRFGNDFRER